MIADSDDDREALAGEYVLGLLGIDERAQVDRLRAFDARVERSIRAWRRRLGDLDGLASPVSPDPSVWPRIAAELTPAAAPTIAPAAAAPPLRPRDTTPSGIDRLWSSVAFWRFSGLAGACAALALALLTYLQPPAQDTAPVALTVLVDERSRPGWIVEARADRTLRVLPLMPADVPPGRALELWTLRDRAEGPISLGLMPPEGSLSVPLDGLPPPRPGQLFEITLEPAAGSPIGRPTGPILYKGNVAGIPAV